MRELIQNTARNITVFMTDSTDHLTGKAGLSLTITASKDGAAFASITPAATERGSGWYALFLTASHTDTLGDLAIHITATGADATDLLCVVVVGLPGVAQTGDAYALALAIRAKTDALPADPADASDIAASFATVNGSLTTISGYIDTEVAAIKAKTDNLPASPAAAGDIPTAAEIWTTVLAESYAADGAAFTGAQALFMIFSALSEFAIADADITCKKLDGSTQAMVFTMDSPTAPTSRTRTA